MELTCCNYYGKECFERNLPLSTPTMDLLKKISTSFPDVFILEPRVFGDERGFFLESYNRKVFAELGITHQFVQDNHSRSTRNVLRGLHYQVQHAQAKLVRVIEGEILDVAVDMRRSSAMFGKSEAVALSGENKRMLWIPAGFAHGFRVVSAVAHVVYKTSDYYAPEYERTLLWSDPQLKIDWQLEGEPIVSAKDQRGVKLRDAESFE
jgi:dTDP-4-dehydrorhamnose 3,5-epimerase